MSKPTKSASNSSSHSTNHSANHTSTKERQPPAGWARVQQPHACSSPEIDKLVLVLPKSVGGVDAEDMAAALRQVNEGGARVSAKGQAYNSIRNFRLPSNASFVVAWQPRRPERANHVLQITFNPRKIEEDDVEEVKRILRAIWPTGWRAGIKTLRVYRVDECCDRHGTNVANLILHKKQSVAGAKVFVQTDRDGEVQTIYASSFASPTLGVAYDQRASDQYKSAVGEKTEAPLQKRQGLKEAAEVCVERTRFEVRRTFKKPITWEMLAERKESSLNTLDVFEIPADYFDKNKNAMFCMFLDVVRLRGVAGARKRLNRLFPKKGKKRVAEMLAMLSELSAPWWNESRRADAVKTLKATASWAFLRFAFDEEGK